jgi:peptidoglycan/xylan/chitin deacetylase (PgdA/CDA1 family)
VKPQVVFHGDRSRKRVALTFDACATKIASGYDEEVIRVLIETRTPATLFLGGKWMLEHPDETRRLAAVDLFELGNHSFLHPHMTRIPDELVRQELAWTQIVLYSLTGRQASLYRPPYGEHAERISNIAAEAGLITVQFDLASGDPDPGISKERLLRSVATGARNGSIVVMHMNARHYYRAAPKGVQFGNRGRNDAGRPGSRQRLSPPLLTHLGESSSCKLPNINCEDLVWQPSRYPSAATRYTSRCPTETWRRF